MKTNQEAMNALDEFLYLSVVRGVDKVVFWPLPGHGPVDDSVNAAVHWALVRILQDQVPEPVRQGRM